MSENPKWLENTIRYGSSALSGAAGLFLTQGILKMTDSNLSAWVMFVIAGGLGVLAIFFHEFAEWLLKLYWKKKLRYLFFSILICALLFWLGMPWIRVQNLIKEVSVKQPLITEVWMSEQECEEYISEQLRTNSDKEVFLSRVRYILVWKMEHRTLGRYRCKGDTAWNHLNLDVIYSSFGIANYDGTKTLSDFMGCEIQYAIQNIKKIDWVREDSTRGIRFANPN